jgi:hypothetical protein
LFSGENCLNKKLFEHFLFKIICAQKILLKKFLPIFFVQKNNLFKNKKCSKKNYSQKVVQN